MIKKWLKKWLEITALKEKLIQQKKFNTQLQQEISNLENRFNSFQELVGVGVDIHVGKRWSGTGSWAVVCLQGQKDYINFIDLSEKSIDEIARFLRHFDVKNAIIDRPFGMNKKLFF